MDTRHYLGQKDGETLLLASGKPSPSETQARGLTKARLGFQERVLPAKHKKLYLVQSLVTWSSIAFQDSVAPCKHCLPLVETTCPL